MDENSILSEGYHNLFFIIKFCVSLNRNFLPKILGYDLTFLIIVFRKMVNGLA